MYFLICKGNMEEQFMLIDKCFICYMVYCNACKSLLFEISYELVIWHLWMLVIIIFCETFHF